MSKRIYAEQWPVPTFIEEELEARGIPLQSFLDVTGIDQQRWKVLAAGEKGLMLKESERIAGALGVSMDFISNLNLSYMKWKKAHP